MDQVFQAVGFLTCLGLIVFVVVTFILYWIEKGDIERRLRRLENKQ